jgi:hypothetical protein
MTFLDNGEEKLKRNHQAIIKCLQKNKKQKEKRGFGLATQYQVHLIKIPCLVQHG